MNLSREEQETLIRSSAADSTWDVCTADPRIIRRMERLGYQPDDRKNPWGYVSFTVPFGRVRILKPVNLTEKQKSALAKTQFKAKSTGEIAEPPDQIPSGNG